LAVDVDIDVALLKSEIQKTYASVSTEPERDFIFPTGRAWAEDLGYPEELTNVPEMVVESFVGQRNLAVTANTYTHVLADERELDYAKLLA